MGGKLSRRKKHSKGVVLAAEETENNFSSLQGPSYERTLSVPAEGKFIEEGPARTPWFVQYIPPNVSFFRELPMVERGTSTIYKAKCVWKTSSQNTFMVGATGTMVTKQNTGTPYVWVVNEKYVMTPHKLTKGDAVLSGVCVSSELSIVHVKHSTNTIVYTVRIDIHSKTPTVVDPVAMFEVTDPCFVFRFSKNKFGVVSAQQACIEVYKLMNVMLESTVESYSTISLDLPQGVVLGEGTRVCVTPDSDICLSVDKKHIVYVFSGQGDLLYTLGQKRELDDPALPGMLYKPVSVQCGEDNRVIISCLQGDIHINDGDKWTLAKDKTKDEGKNIVHSVVTFSRLWTVSEKGGYLTCNSTVYWMTVALEMLKDQD